MSFLTADLQPIEDAATNLASIGSTIASANIAAAAATMGVLPAAADEVSTQIATLFSQHGLGYQQLGAQAAAFHAQFVQALTAGAGAYASAEANVVQTLANAGPMAAQAASTNPVGSFLQQLETAQINFATNLVNSEFGFNQALVSHELGLERAIFGTNAALNGAVDRSFAAGNLLLGAGEQAVNTLVGAPVPANFNSSLLTEPSTHVFNGGQIGGLLGAFDQGLVTNVDLASLVVGSAPAQAVLNVLPPPVQALLTSSPGPFLQQLEAAQINFNTNLINGELSFNQELVNNEVVWEHSVFGTDSALNGVINRGFNVIDLLWGTGQQTVNTLVGAQPGPDFTSSLLTGTGQQVFNGGQIGGLLGDVDQSLAFGVNLVGLFTGQ